MSPQTSTVSLYPPEGFGAPKNRRGHAMGSNVGLPEGTVVFSADNHISLAADIFYERFPDDLKEKAPRIWYEDGAYQVGRKGQSFLPGDFSAVLMQYDDLPGAASTNIEARIHGLTDYLHERMDELNVPIFSPRSREHRAGITILGATDPARATSRLREMKVFVSARGRGIRVAVHFYNNRDDINRLAEALAGALKD